MRDMKMRHHKNASRENARHENAGKENARQTKLAYNNKPTLSATATANCNS